MKEIIDWIDKDLVIALIGSITTIAGVHLAFKFGLKQDHEARIIENDIQTVTRFLDIDLGMLEEVIDGLNTLEKELTGLLEIYNSVIKKGKKDTSDYVDAFLNIKHDSSPLFDKLMSVYFRQAEMVQHEELHRKSIRELDNIKHALGGFQTFCTYCSYAALNSNYMEDGRNSNLYGKSMLVILELNARELLGDLKRK